MKLKQFNFKNISSTNDKAIKIIKNSNNKYGIIVADKQKNGRGQYGKKWISYKGNLFVSIYFKLDKINLSITQMTKINCCLVKKLISSYYKKKITIRLPNDLLINKKKVCGILQEMIKKTDETYMIVGVGINLIKNPNIFNYPTTNLSDATNKEINKKEVIIKLKKIYEYFIPLFSKLNLKKINKIYNDTAR